MLIQLAALQSALAARLASVPTTPVPPTPPQWVKAPEVAAALAIPLARVYELQRTGRVPVQRLGRSVRFDLEAVRRALAA